MMNTSYFPKVNEIDVFYKSINGKNLYKKFSSYVNNHFDCKFNHRKILAIGYFYNYVDILNLKKNECIIPIQYKFIDEYISITSLDDLFYIQENNKVNYIISCHFLEYQETIQDNLTKIYHLLEDDGEFIFISPNMYGYLNNNIYKSINKNIFNINRIIEKSDFSYKKKNSIFYFFNEKIKNINGQYHIYHLIKNNKDNYIYRGGDIISNNS